MRLRALLFAVAFFVVTLLVVAPAIAQERQFSVTMPESLWNNLGKMLGKLPWEDTNPIIQAIGRDVGLSMQREQAQRLQDADTLKKAQAEVERLAAEVSRLTEELHKLKAPPGEEPK